MSPPGVGRRRVVRGLSRARDLHEHHRSGALHDDVHLHRILEGEAPARPLAEFAPELRERNHPPLPAAPHRGPELPAQRALSQPDQPLRRRLDPLPESQPDPSGEFRRLGRAPDPAQGQEPGNPGSRIQLGESPKHVPDLRIQASGLPQGGLPADREVREDGTVAIDKEAAADLGRKPGAARGIHEGGALLKSGAIIACVSGDSCAGAPDPDRVRGMFSG